VHSLFRVRRESAQPTRNRLDVGRRRKQARSPVVDISATPPTFVDTTGTPAARASITVTGVPSFAR